VGKTKKRQFKDERPKKGESDAHKTRRATKQVTQTVIHDFDIAALDDYEHAENMFETFTRLTKGKPVQRGY
jgi:hypothetical protein